MESSNNACLAALLGLTLLVTGSSAAFAQETGSSDDTQAGGSQAEPCGNCTAGGSDGANATTDAGNGTGGQAAGASTDGAGANGTEGSPTSDPDADEPADPDGGTTSDPDGGTTSDPDGTDGGDGRDPDQPPPTPTTIISATVTVPTCQAIVHVYPIGQADPIPNPRRPWPLLGLIGVDHNCNAIRI